MDRVEFVRYQDQRILRIDFSGLRSLPELEEVAREASRVIQSQPRDSVLSLVDLTAVPYSLRMVRALGDMAAGNREYVRARAIIGLSDLARPAVEAVARFSGRPAEAFATRAEAVDWLLRRAVS